MINSCSGGLNSQRLSLINQTVLAEGIVVRSFRFLLGFLHSKAFLISKKHFRGMLSVEIEFLMSGSEIGKTFSWSFVFVSPELFPLLSQLLFCMTCSRYQRGDLLSRRGGVSALLCLPPSLMSPSLLLSQIAATQRELSFPLTHCLQRADNSEHPRSTNHSVHLYYNINGEVTSEARRQVRSE